MKRVNLFFCCVLSLFYCLFNQAALASDTYSFTKPYDKSSGIGLRCNQYEGCDHVNSIYVDKKGIVYAGTHYGIAIGTKQQDNSYQFTTVELSTLGVNSIYADTQGNIYAGTDMGLAVGIKNAKDNSYQFSTYLPLKTINSIFVDDQGTIYAGSQMQGIHIGKKESDGTYSFTTYDMFEYSISSIYVDAQGVIYAGGHKSSAVPSNIWIGKKAVNGVYNFDYSYSLPLSSKWIKSLYVDDKGTMYAGTDAGLVIATKDMDGSYKTTATFNYDSVGSVGSVYVDAQGTIYLGTDKGFLIGKSFQFTNFYIPPYHFPEVKVYLDAQGVAYVGTDHGLSIGSPV